MLSFNNLGNLGRFANQMFQYASLKGIATHHGYDFCIPPREVFGQKDPNVNKDLNLYDIFDIHNKNVVRLTQNQVISERMYTFDEELFNNCKDNIDLLGYFQTEKYFKHIEDEIRSDFSFTLELYNTCNEFISSLNSEVISIHVRRGDYLINPNHPVQTLDYYEQALQLLPQELPVLVFSDDYNWCLSQELFDDDRFMISENSSVDSDLCMMTMCDYHIIANSSFSWWGSWLAKSKKTVAPKNWFGDELKKTKKTEDLYLQNWVVI